MNNSFIFGDGLIAIKKLPDKSIMISPNGTEQFLLISTLKNLEEF